MINYPQNVNSIFINIIKCHLHGANIAIRGSNAMESSQLCMEQLGSSGKGTGIGRDKKRPVFSGLSIPTCHLNDLEQVTESSLSMLPRL